MNAKILTLANQARLLAHPRFELVAKVINCLAQAQILSQESLDLVLGCEKLDELTKVTELLASFHLLTQERWQDMVLHLHPDLLFVINLLYQNFLLTPENYARLLPLEPLNRVSQTLMMLAKKGYLNPTLIQAILRFERINHLYDALVVLERAKLLSLEHFNQIARHTGLILATIHLARAMPLTAENFQCLLACKDTPLLSLWGLHHIWRPIVQGRLLTQANIQALRIAAGQEHPKHALMTERNRILAAHAALQSTHTASVNRSVSISAQRLMTVYGASIDVVDDIAAIKAWLATLAPSMVHAAAQRGLERISKPDFVFADVSGISILQLLALAYRAMHDESKRVGTLDDAKALLVQGLYEIQRGYNLGENNRDDGLADNPICPAGTFNKIVEKLAVIHPDVALKFISKELAYTQFPKFVERHAKAYLQRLSTPEDADELQASLQLLEELKADGSVGPIWAKFKDAVEEEFWQEFQEADDNNRSSSKFLELVNCGGECPLPDVSALEEALSRSEFQAQLKRLRRV